MQLDGGNDCAPLVVTPPHTLPTGQSHPSHLLAHGALVRVPRTLVVVGVGDESGDHPQKREGVDFQVRVVEGKVIVR